VNNEHFNAIMRAASRLFTAEVDGRRMVSEGHVLGFTEAEFPQKAATIENFASYYAKWIAEATEEIKPNPEVHFAAKQYVRWFGDRFFIDEAYFQTFTGDAVTWHATPAQRPDPIVVRENGIVIGIIAPLSWEAFVPSEPPSEPTLADLFKRFACEANGNYLQPADAGLRAEIAALEKEIKRIESQIEALEDEFGDAQSELEANKALLEEQQPKVAA
jgi:hypothetical protein